MAVMISVRARKPGFVNPWTGKAFSLTDYVEIPANSDTLRWCKPGGSLERERRPPTIIGAEPATEPPAREPDVPEKKPKSK